MNEDAVKLTSYFGERHRTTEGRFSADALLDLYGRHEVDQHPAARRGRIRR